MATSWSTLRAHGSAGSVTRRTSLTTSAASGPTTESDAKSRRQKCGATTKRPWNAQATMECLPPEEIDTATGRTQRAYVYEPRRTVTET